MFVSWCSGAYFSCDVFPHDVGDCVSHDGLGRIICLCTRAMLGKYGSLFAWVYSLFICTFGHVVKLRGWDLTPAKIESGTGIYLALSLAPESRIPGSERIRAHRLLLFGGICPMRSFPVLGWSATAAIWATVVKTRDP